MVVVYDQDQIHIRDVWEANLDHEMELIRDIVDDYPYIAIDTVFPGIVFESDHISKLSYEALKINVNLTKLIQLGLTFTDADGRLPTCGTDKHCLWQFNFREFDWDKDLHDEISIDLLAKNGIDFEMNKKLGVDAFKFGELLTSSGVVMKDDSSWITFHSALDFGYLVKILTGSNLPDIRTQFDEKVKVYFPVIYDIKTLVSNTALQSGGLQFTAHRLGVKNVGTRHQAGSDSLLTNRVFLKLRETHFKDQGELEKLAGFMHGVE